jgi:hypothetical protein
VKDQDVIHWTGIGLVAVIIGMLMFIGWEGFKMNNRMKGELTWQSIKQQKSVSSTTPGAK